MRIVDTCSIVIGLQLNALLLVLIVRYSRPHLGNYRNILKIFACNDIFMLILHLVVQPASITAGSAIGVFSMNFPDNKFIIALSCTCFTIILSLMNINFLHRFWAVRSPHKIELFSKPSFVVKLILYTSTSMILWLAGCFGTTGNRTGKLSLRQLIPQEFAITDGWLVLHFWSAIPIFFVCIPFATALSSPLFCSDVHPAGLDRWFSVVASFPALDAIAIILLMKDYRTGLVKMIGRKYSRTDVQSSNWKTAQIGAKY